MPTYKLTYFNGRGRAEIIRFIFEVKGVKYEDVRIKQEDWPALKPKTVNGQLPVLEIDGKEHAQSKAIARYLGRELGLYGANNREALSIDTVAELCDDLVMPLVGMFGEKDEEKKKELVKQYYREKAPAVLKNLEKALSENNEGKGFFVGDNVSLADLTFLATIEWVLTKDHPDVLNDFPNLKGVNQRIRAHEKIADWLKRRPETPF